MLGLKLNKYNTQITAKYTGTTMDIRKKMFYIHCEYLHDGYNYELISEPLELDPQIYIKDNLIKSFKVDIVESNGNLNFKKYKIDVSDINNYINSEYERACKDLYGEE